MMIIVRIRSYDKLNVLDTLKKFHHNSLTQQKPYSGEISKKLTWNFAVVV